METTDAIAATEVAPPIAPEQSVTEKEKDVDKEMPPQSAPPPKQKTAQKATLSQLTADIPRDIHGWTNIYIKQQASKAQASIDKEYTLPTVMAIQEAIAGVKLKQVAAAPLEYIEYLRGKCPVYRVGTTDIMCIGNKSTNGYIFRPHIDYVRWILLDTLRSQIGQDVDIHVTEYYPTMFYWPNYCYLAVGIINVSLVYTRPVGEAINPRMRTLQVLPDIPSTAPPSIKK